jgi:hypothetical protein
MKYWFLKYICLIVALLSIIVLTAGCQGGNQQNAATTQLSGNSGNQSPGTSQGNQSSQSSGSGGQSGEQSGGQSIDPKQLISKEEAAALMKENVKDAVTTEQTSLGLKIGFYAPEKSDSKNYLEIVVLQKPQGGGGQSGGGSQEGGSASSSPGQSQGQGGGQGGGGSQGSEISPAMIFEVLKKSMADPNSAEVLHIGDDTFATAPGMVLLSGEYCIYVSAGGTDPAAAKETTKKAAELIVSNLKRIQGSSGS